jgi:hypothetical protein
MLNINSEVTIGKYKGKIIKDILKNDKKEIFNLLKQGVSFDDNVLSLAGIRKNIRNVKITQVFTEYEKDTKIYEKETISLSKILKEIRTLDNVSETDENDNNGYEEIDIDGI